MRHNPSAGSLLHALIQHACLGGYIAWHTFSMWNAVAMVFVMLHTLLVIACRYCLS